MRCILLNPGPVSLSEGVRRAVTRVDLCHREAEFFDLQDQVIKALLDIYQCDPVEWSAVLVGGSGTSATEAMMASLLPQDARLLVLENGVYGERLSKLAGIYAISCQVLQAPWSAEIDLDALAELLASGAITHVAAVHHETTTGRLNPVDEIAALCAEHDVQLLLDAVSSFAAESIPFDSSALQAVAATANKCLHGIPGLAMVLCRPDALAQNIEPRSLSLHLPLWAENQAQRSTPFTPAVNAMLGLAQALKELHKQGGWKARRTRYRKLASDVAVTLHELGVQQWLPAAESSCVLRSYHLPAGLTYNELHDGLKQHGFIIYAGQGDLAEQMFRISTMGEISDYDIARLEQALQSVIAV
ncbi:MAG: 2-aminoethylphosphonate aminotransferase [Gammaproteobacteria bacterium]|nr:MAG: 2-aminoethylphosphonate aminotransferase [Gammaproteobacteria bacterium]